MQLRSPKEENLACEPEDDRYWLSPVPGCSRSTEVKKWLAASLDKTIRLQLSPPAELRAMSALAGPEWINQQNSG